MTAQDDLYVDINGTQGSGDPVDLSTEEGIEAAAAERGSSAEPQWLNTGAAKHQDRVLPSSQWKQNIHSLLDDSEQGENSTVVDWSPHPLVCTRRYILHSLLSSSLQHEST